MSILNKNISYYPSIRDTSNGIEVNLLKILSSEKHKTIIDSLRSESEPEKQNQMKSLLPCYTVAGVFQRRTNAGLISSSGLAAIDLDSAQHYDVIHLLNELKKIPYIAYAGLSCRGKRLFSIIPFTQPDKYVKHYERLLISFEDMGLPMGDDCHKRISQPRYVSFNTNETCFYNHKATPYHLLPKERSYYFVNQNKSGGSKNNFDWCETQFLKSHSFVEGQRHDFIKLLARYCNMKGVPENDTLNKSQKYVRSDFSEMEIKKIVKYIYSTQNNSHNTL